MKTASQIPSPLADKLFLATHDAGEVDYLMKQPDPDGRRPWAELIARLQRVVPELVEKLDKEQGWGSVDTVIQETNGKALVDAVTKANAEMQRLQRERDSINEKLPPIQVKIDGMNSRRDKTRQEISEIDKKLDDNGAARRGMNRSPFGRGAHFFGRLLGLNGGLESRRKLLVAELDNFSQQLSAHESELNALRRQYDQAHRNLTEATKKRDLAQVQLNKWNDKRAYFQKHKVILIEILQFFSRLKTVLTLSEVDDQDVKDELKDLRGKRVDWPVDAQHPNQSGAVSLYDSIDLLTKPFRTVALS